MQQHPLLSSVPGRILAILFVVIVIALQFALLESYTPFPWEVALADSLIYAGLFAGYGYLLWYTMGYMKALQIQIVLALLVQAVCVAGSYMAVTANDPGLLHPFIATLPFRILFGLMGWLILAQGYHIIETKQELLETRNTLQEETLETESRPAVMEDAPIDRISVKDGTRIHIVYTQDLLYIQASGDYVTLFTPTGQYVKEQTMKYFVEHLPPEQFVRIHRSCIVNTAQIARIELFGKETYQIRLNNGAYLKASITGYKLLKERLHL